MSVTHSPTSPSTVLSSDSSCTSHLASICKSLLFWLPYPVLVDLPPILIFLHGSRFSPVTLLELALSPPPSLSSLVGLLVSVFPNRIGVVRVVLDLNRVHSPFVSVHSIDEDLGSGTVISLW
ncbi:hypothetical protein Scep_023460 [Stephania cephalantha]|uniref:Uncharacterized protein n=1 Tax=Stephania cephalantha TaxID=152367 RepID=A0AAP0EUR9_9MAGN